LATLVELQRQLDECRKEHGDLESQLQVKVKISVELELKLKILLEVEVKIRLELEDCRVTNEELRKQLEECREEKGALESELGACEVEEDELQRELEDTRKTASVLAEANEAAAKAYDAEKAKITKEIEEFKKKKE
jgi:chromosome segregation ATPase